MFLIYTATVIFRQHSEILTCSNFLETGERNTRPGSSQFCPAVGLGSTYSKSPTSHLKYLHNCSTITPRNSVTSPRIHLDMTWRVRPVSRATVAAVIGRDSFAWSSPINTTNRFFTAILHHSFLASYRILGMMSITISFWKRKVVFWKR